MDAVEILFIGTILTAKNVLDLIFATLEYVILIVRTITVDASLNTTIVRIRS